MTEAERNRAPSASRRERAGDKRQRAAETVRRLHAEYPDARCALDFHSPEELLVATILSAQCTDSMVNSVTPELFGRFPVPERLAEAGLREIQHIVRPCGYYRQKSKHIREACRIIETRFGGMVPRTIEELTTLPGVARKTANVVLSVAFGINEGVAVDTHVARLSRRLRFTASERPEKIEGDLMKLVARKEWGDLTMLLIAHGRAVCAARKPRCGSCVIADLCPSAFRC